MAQNAKPENKMQILRGLKQQGPANGLQTTLVHAPLFLQRSKECCKGRSPLVLHMGQSVFIHTLETKFVMENIGIATVEPRSVQVLEV